jgi:hypothetical protein
MVPPEACKEFRKTKNSFNMKKPDILTGYVVFTLINKGSKSEQFAPLLLTDEGQTVKLVNTHDSPLSYESFTPYHLVWCEIEGQPENSVFKVDRIKPKPDPAKKFLDSGSAENQNDFPVN